MNDLLLLLFLLSFIALIIGILKPGIVIRWGDIEKRNRKNVFKYYGLGIIIFLVLFNATLPEVEPTSEAMDNSIQAEQKSSEEIVKKVFELSDSDIELLKGSYDTFTNEQISRFSKIESEHDNITIEGMCVGNQTYTTVMGAEMTMPNIKPISDLRNYTEVLN